MEIAVARGSSSGQRWIGAVRVEEGGRVGVMSSSRAGEVHLFVHDGFQDVGLILVLTQSAAFELAGLIVGACDSNDRRGD
jgi:hypothetical protein